LEDYLPHITIGVLVELIAVLVTFPWILTIKKDSTAAMAWCLIVLLVPLVGVTLFLVFGYTRVDRPMRRKRRHHVRFVARKPAHKREATEEAAEEQLTGIPLRLGQIASRLGAFGPVGGNEVTLYHETQVAFDHLCDTIRDARHHIHLQYFIIQPDESGRKIIELLTAKAKEGVQVRLLYDAIGSHRLTRRMLRSLVECNGQCRPFLGFASLRRIAVNMRNHRKIAVIDGRYGYTGGANIGNEYLGKDPHFGYWRDSQLRLEGPGVAGLQNIFVEDWDFATGETLLGDDYFPELPRVGDATVQIIAGGPDQDMNSIRELVFSAVTMARERLWIASPYIVPDQGILDALRFAARLGVDVRLLCPLKPDHWLTYYAGRYYFTDLMAEGIKLYEYAKGMMHSKTILVDGQWASVGSANLDYRSLHLNFEANCLIYSPDVVAELEEAYRKDLQQSIRLEAHAFRGRSFATRLLENGCRLLSPTL
jgi:cardiolipin synthase A/B